MDYLDAIPSLLSEHGPVDADPTAVPDNSRLGDAEALLVEMGFSSFRESDAMSSIPALGRGTKRCASGLFAGDLHRGTLHSRHMLAAKREHAYARDKAAKEAETQPLRTAWNRERQRYGDHVGKDDGESRERKPHPNQWPSTSVMTSAWRQVGSNKTMRVGLDGLSKELAVLTTVSGAAWQDQRDFVTRRVADMTQRCRSPSVLWWYDASPRQFAFGRLQEELMPLARYPYFDGDRWQSLTLNDYLAKVPSRKVLCKGVLDILASSVECRYFNEDDTLDGFKVLVRPQVLGEADASCLHTALSNSVPELSHTGIPELCKQCPCVFVNDQPDACAVNGRHQMETEERLAGIRNAFYNKGRCASHQCHRVVAAVEKRSIGHESDGMIRMIILNHPVPLLYHPLSCCHYPVLNPSEWMIIQWVHYRPA